MQSDLYPQPLDVLREVFDYQSFRSGQDAVIEQLVAGNDVLAIMPTGGGKSLCYQIPALVRPGLAIVVSPLIALIKDQVDALRANGVAAAGLHSGLARDELLEVYSQLWRGDLKLLCIAPERILLPDFLARLQDLPTYPTFPYIARLLVEPVECRQPTLHYPIPPFPGSI